MHPGIPGEQAIAQREAEVFATGHALLAAGAGRRPALFRGVDGWLLARCTADPGLLTALFRLVDALPQLLQAPTPRAAVAGHLAAYLQAGGRRPSVWLRLAAHPALAWAVIRQVRGLAGRLLADEGPGGLERVLARLEAVPALATVDAVGEAVLGEAEADAYRDRNLQLLARLARRAAPPHLSLKLSALTPRFDPLDPGGSRRRVFARLEPIVAAACACGATLNVDMEQYELKPLILGLFFDLLAAFPDPRWQPAIALQAYLPEAGADIEAVLAAAQRHGRRLGVRLVKGAYWEQEAAWAAQRNRPFPAWRDKAQTDLHYERLSAVLLARTDSLTPAIAGHNLRSQAHALATARRFGLPRESWEAQLLYGMAEPLRDSLVAAGVRVRVYVPSGDLDSGIAYLIRRLLENTASTSILRQAHVDGRSAEALLAPPAPAAATPAEPGGWSNLPLLDFSRPGERELFAAALAEVRAGLPRRHRLPAAARHLARNPAAPDEILGEIGLAHRQEAAPAVAAARLGFAAWSQVPARERVALLERAAAILSAERRPLAALEVLEVGKNWREADADVAEAIDFLRYYGRCLLAIDGWRPTAALPGENNLSAYAARGVAVVITPWNFPLAILAGMTSAALAAGNAVIMKPALPALLCAHAFLDVLARAGLPAGVCQLLAGGAELGQALVTHPEVDVVAFTGSRAVGLDILRLAHTPAPGQARVKQVVCEMGGKNAVIVDEDADLDAAVAGVIASAFGFQGQKCSACSRLIAVGGVHDRLLARLCAAADALAWGPPEDPACEYGPLISAEARARALAYIEVGHREGRLAWQGKVPEGGCYVPPCIFAGIRPEHRLAREEIFAPLLAVLHAPDFASALAWANDSDYALTGGVYSRLPAHLEAARRHFRVGNLYLNRQITGARVGVQPFGGVGLSGTGIQAGGPDYLRQFLWSRTLSENTQRHGFIPDAL